jgi:hypothetical protein
MKTPEYLGPCKDGKSNLPRRVKLLELPDSAQAIVHVRDDAHLEITVYGYSSNYLEVQFVAPFAFESKKSRDEAFANDDKLADFAKAIFITQMVGIDPNLNTDNFKSEK